MTSCGPRGLDCEEEKWTVGKQEVRKHQRRPLFKKVCQLKNSMCKSACTCENVCVSQSVEVTWQAAGVSSFLELCGWQRLSSGSQAWEKLPLPAEPSCPADTYSPLLQLLQTKELFGSLLPLLSKNYFLISRHEGVILPKSGHVDYKEIFCIKIVACRWWLRRHTHSNRETTGVKQKRLSQCWNAQVKECLKQICSNMLRKMFYFMVHLN